MQHSKALAAAVCLALAGSIGVAMPAMATTTAGDHAQQAAQLPNIHYTRFTLPNGLTVIVSPDHKAPVVAVAVWYHVGAAREPAGKTGYAHLFEHLMFEGSAHHKGNYFKPFQKVGATGMNGTTNSDRTNYFETVPTTALDMALWMESDRMGWLLQGLTQASVDQQRGVVQNEKRQDENQPYGLVQENIAAHAYPANHPYHHTTIGSMKDLDAASLDDFRHWFKSYYGPNNATLVLVGDITVAQAKAKALKYFGNIPAGPAVAPLKPWTAARTTSTKGVMHSDVPQTRIYREWNTPADGTHADNLLSLAADVLGGSRSSRLYQRLVYQDKLADNVSVSDRSGKLGSQFVLVVTPKKGADLAKINRAVSDVWAKFLKDGPTAAELERAKTGFRASFVRRLERVGGFSGKAMILGRSETFHGSPDAWRKALADMLAATPTQVRDAARQWLSRGDYTLTVLPVAKGEKPETANQAMANGLGPASGKPVPAKAVSHDWKTVASTVDRSKGVPAVTRFPSLTFPKLQHATLDNGIKVTLAERSDVPLVEMSLQFAGGFASDPDHQPGRANFTMSMLDEGTKDLDSVQISDRTQLLGAQISAGCGLDSCQATLNSLTDKLDPSLALFADIVEHPAFRGADVQRLRGQWIAGIAQEKARPVTLALRTLPNLLYGKGHPYAMPFTGSGTVASIQSLKTTDMRDFMRDYVRPDNVRILVAGDISMDALVKKLNHAFGDWKAPATAVPTRAIAKVAKPAQPRVFLMDRPGSLQSTIFAGVVAPSTKAPNDLAIGLMNGAFGGSFNSRLNLDLREAKHWAYGAHSFLPSALGQRPFMLYASVQTDKTAPSIQSALADAKAITSTQPITDAELAKVKANQVHALPGEFQTNGAVLGELRGMALYQRPDNYVTTLKQRIDAVPLTKVQAAADAIIQPRHFTWVIVGDLARVGASIRALNLGQVTVLDADGQPVKDTAKAAK
ncbi:MAG TPA: pitrilysin family protein [Rhodanobacteraceae bacterium]